MPPEAGALPMRELSEIAVRATMLDHGPLAVTREDHPVSFLSRCSGYD